MLCYAMPRCPLRRMCGRPWSLEDRGQGSRAEPRSRFHFRGALGLGYLFIVYSLYARARAWRLAAAAPPPPPPPPPPLLCLAHGWERLRYSPPCPVPVPAKAGQGLSPLRGVKKGKQVWEYTYGTPSPHPPRALVRGLLALLGCTPLQVLRLPRQRLASRLPGPPPRRVDPPRRRRRRP
jgi:hypothetical protein